MILELGERYDAFEWIRVTAEYSNAVLVAVLPYVSNVVEKLDLPVPRPVTVEQVTYCEVAPQRKLAAGIGIKGDWRFVFSRGYIDTIQGPRHFFGIQDFDRIPEFFGETKISKNQAVQLARDTLRKLDIPLESVFAEQEPRVTGPLPNGTNTIPRYLVEWFDPRSTGQAAACVKIDIDGQANRVDQIQFHSLRSLERPPPQIEIVPPLHPAGPRRWPHVSAEYAWKLIPIALRAVEEYAQKLALPIPHPLTTNQVAMFSLADNGGWPHSEIELTNGWHFIYRNSTVNGYYAPDALYGLPSQQRPVLIKDFLGEWNMTEAEAIELIRQTLAKLGHSTNLVNMDFAPRVVKPFTPGIARYSIWWWCEDETGQDLISKVEAEVDADKRELKSLYFDHKSFWNKPPPIDVPITAPQTNAPRSVSGPESDPSVKTVKPPARPFAPFDSTLKN
jgi:hypothetical protein